MQLKAIMDFFKNSLFLHIKRDPLYTAQSLLICRQEIRKDEHAWFSLLPNSCLSLLDVSPYKQVASQVYYSRNEICNQAHEYSNNYFELNYEDLCLNTKKVFSKILSFIFNENQSRSFNYNYLPDSLTCNNIQQLPDNEFLKLKNEIALYFIQEDTSI